MTEKETTKSSLERTLDLTISAEQLKADTDAILKRRAKTAKAHGFRPGKVPMKMVREMYGAQAYMDAMNQLIGHAYEKAVEEHWKRQSEETKIVAKRNKMKSEMFNKQFKKKSSFFSFFRWNRNKMNDNALMDGVRDTR